MIKSIHDSASGARPFGRTALVAVGGFYLCLILLFIFLAFRTDRLAHFPVSPEYPMNLVFGGMLLVYGVAFWVWCALKFFAARGTPVPLRPPPKLITDGPYRIIRNPMLTGIFAVMFSIGFLAQSISLVFLFTPLFILINYLEIRLIEEPELERRFGAQYGEYRKRTPMFFPSWKKRN